MVTMPRVGEGPGGARLAEQPLAHALLLIGLQDGAQIDRFDRHRPADIGVNGVINHTHGPSPQLPDDLVSPDAVHSF